jgi:hypothetical protein
MEKKRERKDREEKWGRCRRTKLEESVVNAVSLDVGPEMLYSMIQRQYECAQLAWWVSHYFPY